ncbi:MAG: cob(I)yrinic acid a,c-diamide adenosyltransferase, partial [Candidatus Berkelbacteria bacterium]|nr:cob(I)yrinic acid a,c-diamide adenosyltransferase [Candidatus Berkelbacteria bacterium]
MGQIHVYTGNGKGKTTAAFGLAIRALGRGKKVAI